jgi:hypothetical protein
MGFGDGDIDDKIRAGFFDGLGQIIECLHTGDFQFSNSGRGGIGADIHPTGEIHPRVGEKVARPGFSHATGADK